MPSDFSPASIAYGLHLRELSSLDAKTKDKMVRLMARIAEKSYRRGYQHGRIVSEDDKAVDASHLRFHVSLDRSPFTDTFHPNGRWAAKSGTSSVHRLGMECPEIEHVMGPCKIFSKKEHRWL